RQPPTARLERDRQRVARPAYALDLVLEPALPGGHGDDVALTQLRDRAERRAERGRVPVHHRGTGLARQGRVAPGPPPGPRCPGPARSTEADVPSTTTCRRWIVGASISATGVPGAMSPPIGVVASARFSRSCAYRCTWVRPCSSALIPSA